MVITFVLYFLNGYHLKKKKKKKTFNALLVLTFWGPFYFTTFSP